PAGIQPYPGAPDCRAGRGPAARRGVFPSCPLAPGAAVGGGLRIADGGAHQASLQHYTTAIGGQRTLPLPACGSTLLDTATSVSVAADASHAVTLERG